MSEEEQDVSTRIQTLLRRDPSQRTLRRVSTAHMDLPVTMIIDQVTVQGRLLDVSGAGCHIRASFPMEGDRRLADAWKSRPVVAILPAPRQPLHCDAEIIALSHEQEDATIDLRLRFRWLPAQTRQALLAWLGVLTWRNFCERYGEGTASSSHSL